MKHPLIMLGTAGGILILGGMAWSYFFLFYQAPPVSPRVAENPFVEVDAGSFGTTDAMSDGSEPTASATPSSITAVTMRRVAGAVGLAGGVYRFVEAGTGHVYETSVEGSEVKISNTTYPRARDAVWTNSGSAVAISYDVEGEARTAVEYIGAERTEAATSTTNGIVGDIHSVGWSEDERTLRFVRETERGSEAIAYDPLKKSEKVLFQVPLRDTLVVWDTTPLVTPRASRSFIGYAYRSDLTRVTNGMPALTAASHQGTMLFSGISDASLTSWFVADDVTTSLDTGVIPEKCALTDSGAICALPKRFDSARYPDEWYRGEEIYDDEVVLIDASTGEMRELGDLSTPFRTPLDITEVQPTEQGALMLSRDGHLVSIAVTQQ